MALRMRTLPMRPQFACVNVLLHASDPLLPKADIDEHKLSVLGHSIFLCTSEKAYVVSIRRVAVAGTVESALQHRAKLTHTEPTLRGMAVTTHLLARRLRTALAAVDLVSNAGMVTAVLRQRADGVNSRSVDGSDRAYRH